MSRSGDGCALRFHGTLWQRLLDVGEVADRMGVTVRFVRRLVAQRRLPYRKLGKFVRFDPAEVEDGINARRVDSIH